MIIGRRCPYFNTRELARRVEGSSRNKEECTILVFVAPLPATFRDMPPGGGRLLPRNVAECRRMSRQCPRCVAERLGRGLTHGKLHDNPDLNPNPNPDPWALRWHAATCGGTAAAHVAARRVQCQKKQTKVHPGTCDKRGGSPRRGETG